MTTAREVIEGACRKIGVIAIGESLSSEEAADCLTAFNDLLHGLEMDGVWLGHTNLSLTDTVNLPDSHIGGLKALLAVSIAPEYERTAAPTTIDEATRFKALLESAYAQDQTMTFDTTLLRMPSRGK